jgi:hypothetical protein
MSMKNRFQRNRNPHQEFKAFIDIILDGYEKEIAL